MKQYYIILFFAFILYSESVQSQTTQQLQYNLYETGIQTRTIIQTDDWKQSFSMRRKDPISAKWSSHLILTLDSLNNPKYRLPGSLRNLPSLLSQLVTADWDKFPQININGPQGKKWLYVKHRRMAETVNGKTETAWYWALKDGGVFNGMLILDLVIDEKNRLIAAIDPSSDNSVVLNGYKNLLLKNFGLTPTFHLLNMAIGEQE
jgi:hypothetical protein